MMNIASVKAEYKQVDRYCTNSGCLKAGHQAESQARSMLLLYYYCSTTPAPQCPDIDSTVPSSPSCNHVKVRGCGQDPHRSPGPGASPS